MRFIDSHLHLADSPEPAGLLSYARESDSLYFAASTSRSTSMITLKFAEENAERVRAFVGVHPSEAEREGDGGWLAGALEAATGVGEIGLDPSYSEVGENSAQLRLFRSQLSAAEQSGKPVQVHSRGAAAQCLTHLRSHSLRGVLLHWFEDENLLREACDLGCLVSFGPALLYSKKLQRMAAACHEDLVLTETDGPVAFAPLGGVGGPWLVPSVVFRLAQALHRSFEDTAVLVGRNAAGYLGARGKG